MAKRFLLNPFEEAERQSQDRGYWIVATVEPRMSWPTQKQTVTFEDMDFVLFPQSSDAGQSAGIALRADLYGLDSQAARRCITRFCSALAWAEGTGIEILTWIGGNLPRPAHVQKGRVVVEYLDPSSLPNVKSGEEKAVIALYREGTSLDNPFYAFLSLYKAISVVIPNGKKRGAWISKTLNSLDDHLAKKRRDELLAQGIEVGKYLWQEDRNAIAHAEKQPYVNPDEVDDHYRLHQDIPLMRNLAELAIEQHTELRRSHTLWREHLYELEGFREILPDEIIELLKKSEPIPEGTTIQMPERYTVIARRGAEINAFEDLYPQVIAQVVGGMKLDFITKDEAIRIRTVLSFAEERLLFDPIQGLGFVQNREDQKHIRLEIVLLKFQFCILCNGHLEIWDQETERILGRSETCIPVNCFVNHEFYKSELAMLNGLLNK